MIFQNYALFPHMTVRQNIGYGLEVKGLPRREQDARSTASWTTLGLDARRRQPAPTSCPAASASASRSPAAWSSSPTSCCWTSRSGALDANLRKVVQNELKLLQENSASPSSSSPMRSRRRWPFRTASW